MKAVTLTILFLCTLAGFAQSNKQSDTPVQILYGERSPDQRRHGPIISGGCGSQFQLIMTDRIGLSPE